MALRSQPLAMGLKQITGLADAVNAKDAINKGQLDAGLDGKANTVHTHVISDVTSLQTAIDGKEPAITAGTTSQYWRGDKTWQAFPAQKLVATYRAALTTTASTAVVMANPPTSTGGLQILSLDVTTTTATQIVDFYFKGIGSLNSNVSIQSPLGLFVGSTLIGAAVNGVSSLSYGNWVAIGRYSPGAAGTYTITVRFGTTNTSYTVSIGEVRADSTNLICYVIEP